MKPPHTKGTETFAKFQLSQESIAKALIWLLLMAIAGLAGCATMTKEQCLEANATSWKQIGWQDGSDGWDPNRRLAMHREACKEVRILPDRATYMQGWSSGVVEYCTPDRAYSEGLRGSSGNSSVCPHETRSLFDDNVSLGRRVYDLRNQISSLNVEISSYEKNLRDPKIDRDTKRDLHTKIRNRDEELTHLRILLNEALAMPVIRD